MEIYSVAFFGHRYIDNILQLEDKLYPLIKKLLCEKDYVEFLVGRNGDFDRCVSSVIRRVRREVRDDNSSHILILPYYTEEYLSNREAFETYYSEVNIYDTEGKIYPKAVIGQRNAEMADMADEVVCYVEKKSGGAYKAVRYAENLGKKITNLAPKNKVPDR